MYEQKYKEIMSTRLNDQFLPYKLISLCFWGNTYAPVQNIFKNTKRSLLDILTCFFPLLSSLHFSLMSGLAALDAKCSSRLGIMTISYYLWTTFVAVVVGILMVYIIHPGGAAQKEDSDESKKPMTSSADALLDLIR